MRLTITTEIAARWGHRVDGLIHSHAWTVGATVEGPADASIVIPADELEAILLESVGPWTGHYLTDEDLGPWKSYEPMVWDKEPTVEEIARRLWDIVSERVAGLVEVFLVEASEFDRTRTVRLMADRSQVPA